MKTIQPSATIISKLDYEETLRLVELAGRVCYKSEDKIKEDSAEKFIAAIIKRGHESVIEHVSVTARFVVDRGVSHEIVRHRLASFSQESTRYCNYAQDKFGSELTFIKPSFYAENSLQYASWERAMVSAEKSYFELLSLGATPEQARAVLPNSVKTELFMTANMREWRHFFKLRTGNAAHPQMREVAEELLSAFKQGFPVFFADLN
ncbi:thymidylate synthase [Clostridia bacterium]|nr:thymidylate synthase [Clostridia bacterium]